MAGSRVHEGAAAASGWPVGASLEPPGLPSARRDGANSDAAVAGYSFVAIAAKYRYGTNSHNVSFKNAVWQTFSSAVQVLSANSVCISYFFLYIVLFLYAAFLCFLLCMFLPYITLLRLLA